jgi:hypothetical protein
VENFLTDDILLHEDSFEEKEAKYWKNIEAFVIKKIRQPVAHVTKGTTQYVTHCML